MAVVVCLVVNNWGGLVSAVPLAVVGLFLGGAIGGGVGKVLAEPVRLRDYSPSDGTVLLWFRNPEYGDALMEILGGEEEPGPEDETAVGSGAAAARAEEG